MSSFLIRMCSRLLTQRGWAANEKRFHRLWNHEHAQIPQRQHRKLRFDGSSESGCIRHRFHLKNHGWLYDFVMDRTKDGPPLRLLVGIDE